MVKKVIIIILVLIIGLTIFLLSFIKKTPNTIQNGQLFCQTDSDCIVVSSRNKKNPCCWNCGYEVLNKDASEQRILWEDKNCTDRNTSGCMICKAQGKYLFRAMCKNQSCQLISASDECGSLNTQILRDNCYKDFEIKARKQSSIK